MGVSIEAIEEDGVQAGPLGRVGVVCARNRFDEVRHEAATAGVLLAWTETSLERASPLLHSAQSVLVEWPTEPPTLHASLFSLLSRARRPAVVIVGSPTRSDLFKLTKAGIDEYFERFTIKAFHVAAGTPSNSPENLLRQAARTNLGLVGVKDAQKIVRVEMFREALLSENGNRHAAARILKVDRRYVLKMAKEGPPASLTRKTDPRNGA